MAVAVRRSILPGFGLTMGLTLTLLSVIVLIPLAGLFLKTSELSLDQFWAIVRADPLVIVRTVLAGGAVAGHAAIFGPPSEREVTYVIARRFWGRGVATAALAQLIDLEQGRPLHADAAADNAGSIRVLEKCGFAVTGRTRSFARARGEEIELVQLTLT